MSITTSITKLLSGNIIVTGTNLLRDISIATTFGASREVDLFFLSISIPVFLLTIVADVMRSASVPLLTEADNGKGEKSYVILARKISADVCKLSMAVFITSVIVAEVFWVMAKHQYDISFTLWIMVSVIPMYALGLIIEASQGILQVKSIYFIPVIARLGVPLGIICGAYFFSDVAAIFALGICGFIGCSISLFVLYYAYQKAGIVHADCISKLPFNTAKRFHKSLTFLTIGAVITYINPLVDQWMGDLYGGGAVAYIGYASRLTVGIASIIVGSLSPVILSYYSQAVADDNKLKIQAVFDLSFTAFVWLGNFIALSCWFLSKIIIDFLYGHGNFSTYDVEVVAKLMNCYVVQFPFFFASTVTFTLISAISKNELFIKFGLIMLVVNALGNWLLASYFGIFGIACSTALVYAVSLFLMCRSLHLIGVIKIRWKSLLESLIAFMVLIGIGGYLYVIEYWHFSPLKDRLTLNIIFGVSLWFVFGLVAYQRTKKSLAF